MPKLTRLRWLAIGAFMGIIPLVLVPYYLGVLQNIVSTIEAIVAGIAVAMVLGGITLWQKGKTEKPKTVNLTEKSEQKAKEQPETILADNELMKGVEYYPTRDRRVLDRLLGKIRTNGIFIGTELDIVLGMKTELRNILTKYENVKLSFYVLDPYDQDMIALSERTRVIAQGTSKRAPGNVIDFCNFHKELELKDPTRLRLFKYKYIPIHSIIAVNPELDDAEIQIESYLHTVEGQNRPSLIIHKDSQPALFEEYYKSVKWIIANSELHDCHKI